MATTCTHTHTHVMVCRRTKRLRRTKRPRRAKRFWISATHIEDFVGCLPPQNVPDMLRFTAEFYPTRRTSSPRARKVWIAPASSTLRSSTISRRTCSQSTICCFFKKKKQRTQTITTRLSFEEGLFSPSIKIEYLTKGQKQAVDAHLPARTSTSKRSLEVHHWHKRRRFRPRNRGTARPSHRVCRGRHRNGHPHA